MRILTQRRLLLPLAGRIGSMLLILGFSSSARSQIEVENLGVSGFSFVVDGDLVAFPVIEAWQGDVDLNGDGDAFDEVMHVYDASRNVTENLRLANDGAAAISGNLVAFLVSEAAQGESDLNGDGDFDDSVSHVFDSASGRVTNLGVAVQGGVWVGGDLVLSIVYENMQGFTDLNGDGDTDDYVFHAFDHAGGVSTNLGLASASSPTISGDLVVVLVPEVDQGGTDLNGDGDAQDWVLHVFDASTRVVTNVERAAGPGDLFVEGGRVLFAVSESEQGVDLNSDLDRLDHVLASFDPGTGTTLNLALAVQPSAGFAVSGGMALLRVPERDQAGADLNGDGDAIDEVVHAFDLEAGTSVNLRLATGSYWFEFAIETSRLAFLVAETWQGGRSLNGDADADDEVVHVFDAVTGVTTNLGLAAVTVRADGDWIYFTVPEASQGRDLSGDGDALDLVSHFYDAAAGSLINLGLAGGLQEFEDGLALLYVFEDWQGARDLNGDGDALDVVVHVFDTATATTTNVGLAPMGLKLEKRRVVCPVSEFAQGNTDLNGDGDTFDWVVHVYDASTGVTTNTGASAGDYPQEFALQGDLAVFFVNELQEGMDLNGDGDVSDYVLHVIRIGYEAEVLQVRIDIRPLSKLNVINPESQGKVPVAILSSEDFEAADVVRTSSLTFGATGEENSLAFCGRPLDVNHDRRLDVLCFFEIRASGFRAGDRKGFLRGSTFDGRSFEGSDSVWVLRVGHAKKFLEPGTARGLALSVGSP